ncbi:TPA: TetR/AcrR family transcriptional regulator [Clostridioides difficile]|uniref:TetR/AcrR family transcriptional regulator n=1 Tax=Exiguobacterium acetylicum TaxID=41170 RepID=A0ABX8GA78_EXIAC|nr:MULTISPECIES: TetR/AcrR family transcriptional regulator [Exiguobacterium]QWB30326.1 TetR/AcrR family transcriptional regulator [Exiguobacterium acetylicum]HCD59142.1 TetR/AcrR family transcriptional regulator [Exiguobacterium sp.]
MNESRDPRPKRSRDRITMVLFRLLKTHSFSSITVKMLTDGAGVNRSTFYAHYTDKYDLLDQIVEEQMKALEQAIRITGTGTAFPTVEQVSRYFARLFIHIEENELFYQTMLVQGPIKTFISRFLDTLKENYRLMFRPQITEEATFVDRDLLLNYVIGGQLGLLISWLRNGRPYSSEYMAEQLSRMIVFGTVESIGFPKEPE